MSSEKFAARIGVTWPTINHGEKERAYVSPLALKRIEDFLRDTGGQGDDLLNEFFNDNN